MTNEKPHEVMDIGNYVIEAYCEYGKEVNLNRHVPRFEDGLKPSYKRLILSALDQGADRRVKTAKLLGDTMGKYHPHSTDGIEGAVAELVFAGVFEGKGSFGFKGMERGNDDRWAAPRYTEVKLDAKFRKLVSKLLPYVPASINELDNLEPDYIPSPYPLGLQMGSFGIGIGLSVNIPAFEPNSMIKAGYASALKKPEPWKLLKPGYGLEMSDDDKETFWKSNKGTLTYRFTVTPATEMGLSGWNITGDPSFVKPRLDKLHKLQRDGGKVVCKDFSDGSVKREFVAREKRIKTITDSEVESLVYAASEVRKAFNLWVVYKGQTRPITGGDWITKCMLNYNELVKKYRSDSLEKLNQEIEVYTHFREVADKILNTDKTYSEIQSELGLSNGVVDKIGKMSISTLRDLDPQRKLDKLNLDVKYYESLTTKTLLEEFLK